MRLRSIVFNKFWICGWPLDTKKILIIYSHLQNYFLLLYIFLFYNSLNLSCTNRTRIRDFRWNRWNQNKLANCLVMRTTLPMSAYNTKRKNEQKINKVVLAALFFLCWLISHFVPCGMCVACPYGDLGRQRPAFIHTLA